MRGEATDLTSDRLAETLAQGWNLRAGSVKYVPEGGGSHHWKVVDEDGRFHFVTVDDLDDKDWMGDTRERVLEGVDRALITAATLRHDAGLEFLVAPVEGSDGQFLRRLDDRYAVSVFPYLTGRSFPFGPYPDASLRGMALDMIAVLHQATAAAGECVSVHEPVFGGERDLSDFLVDPGRPWRGGPYSEPARLALVPHTADLVELVAAFDHLVDVTAKSRADRVITHGEPHPANLMLEANRLFLINWDTAALGPPERDLSLIVSLRGEGVDRYQAATGREINLAVVRLAPRLDQIPTIERALGMSW